MDRDLIADLLNWLIETSLDGEEYFSRCSELMQQPERKRFFARRAAECAHAASDLQQMILRLDGDSDALGLARRTRHRGRFERRRWWVAQASAEGEPAMIDACLRGQQIAAQRYRQVLATPLPVLLRLALEQQHEGLLRNKDRLCSLVRHDRAVPAPQA